MTGPQNGQFLCVDHIVGVFLHFHNAQAQCVEGLAQCDGGGDGTCGSPHAVVQNIAAHAEAQTLPHGEPLHDPEQNTLRFVY